MASAVGVTKQALLRELVVRFQALVCPGCRRPHTADTLTKHHIQPRAEGGPTVIDNLVLLCRPCHTNYHRGYGETVRAVRKFVRPRGRHFAFPPPPEPLATEEGMRFFFTRWAVATGRVVDQQRFATNPPFDPAWPIGRHLATPTMIWHAPRYEPT